MLVCQFLFSLIFGYCLYFKANFKYWPNLKSSDILKMVRVLTDVEVLVLYLRLIDNNGMLNFIPEFEIFLFIFFSITLRNDNLLMIIWISSKMNKNHAKQYSLLYIGGCLSTLLVGFERSSKILEYNIYTKGSLFLFNLIIYLGIINKKLSNCFYMDGKYNDNITFMIKNKHYLYYLHLLIQYS